MKVLKICETTYQASGVLSKVFLLDDKIVLIVNSSNGRLLSWRTRHVDQLWVTEDDVPSAALAAVETSLRDGEERSWDNPHVTDTKFSPGFLFDDIRTARFPSLPYVLEDGEVTDSMLDAYSEEALEHCLTQVTIHLPGATAPDVLMSVNDEIFRGRLMDELLSEEGLGLGFLGCGREMPAEMFYDVPGFNPIVIASDGLIAISDSGEPDDDEFHDFCFDQFVQEVEMRREERREDERTDRRLVDLYGVGRSSVLDLDVLTDLPYIDPTVCVCGCHDGQSMMHMQPCCTDCDICGAKVKTGMMSEHKEEHSRALWLEIDNHR